MDRGTMLGAKILKENLKRTVVVLVAVTSICAIVQAWTNGYASPLWFSFVHFEFSEAGHPPAPGPAYDNDIIPSATALQFDNDHDGYLSMNSGYNVDLNVTNSSTILGILRINDRMKKQTTGSNDSSSAHHDWRLGNNTEQYYSYRSRPVGLSNVTNGNIPIHNSVTRSNQENNVSHGGAMNNKLQDTSPEEITYERTRSVSGYNIMGSSYAQKEEWVRKLEQQLLSAKKYIENAPLVLSDPDLYAPLYHNLSRFRRSYEMMEKIFMVYIYPDGERPYVHEGPMTAIYASEGWFLRQMEENQQFVTRDFKEAQMFYMPYSVYEMRKGISSPGNHNMPQISLYIKSYVNMISTKYPFWNRTHGRDHFFVACHDWGPYTTREHHELHSNAVKILCNADLSEGYFVVGKDGSLPETNLHSLQQPPRALGGQSAKDRTILAFFAGGNHGRVRPVLFQYWKDKDPDVKVYENLPPRLAKKKSYINHMKESKYCLCPMGYEVSSPRMVEAIYYDCIPVIIADNFFLPFSEVLNWEAFSITVAEKDIPSLKDILLSVSEKRYLSMQLRLRLVRKHFLWHQHSPQRYDIFHMILHSVWTSNLNRIE